MLLLLFVVMFPGLFDGSAQFVFLLLNVYFCYYFKKLHPQV